MNERLILSRPKIATFRTCRRRFQLRYWQRLPWPHLPLDEPAEIALARGQQFHQLLERHFLGLSVAKETIADVEVRRWWTTFQESIHPPAGGPPAGGPPAAGLTLPAGRTLPELSLTIPIGDHLLTGRFDLLIVGREERPAKRSTAHIFDWKTSRPQDEATLKQDWQTRLYLAILAEGGGALQPPGRSLNPDDLSITYWYVTEPDAPRTIHYSQAQHTQNWADLQAILAQIKLQSADATWPLTDDWSHCRTCAYQAYCGRQEAGTAPTTGNAEELAEDTGVWPMEPDAP